MKLNVTFDENDIDHLLSAEDELNRQLGPMTNDGGCYLPARLLTVLKVCVPEKFKGRKIRMTEVARQNKNMKLLPFSFDREGDGATEKV